MKSRILFLQIIMFLFSAAVIARLFTVQVLSREFYKDLAENQHQFLQTLTPVRGEILIKEGPNGSLIPIVANIEKNLVYAVPPEIEQKGMTAEKLASVLDMDPAEIYGRIDDDSRKWVALKKELTESQSLAARKLDLPGIYFQPETYRYYPEKDFASQVLGFLAFKEDERSGTYGIEEQYENILAGEAGKISVEVFKRETLAPAQNGADVVLTLDKAVQFKVEEVLKNTVEAHQAEEGSVVVLDPKSGKILAMANYPDFDPNKFAEAGDPAVFRNDAVSEAYEPGSVFKPITMAAALDSGAVSPETTYEDKGFVVLDDFTIRNSRQKVYGEQNMTQVLEQSINTGVIFAQDQTGPEKFLETVERFGFGRETGIELPAESRGNISNLRGGGAVHYATASFGQGITATPLQIAQAFGAIANQGKLMKARIVEQIDYPDGESKEFGPQEARQVISPRSANILAAMMVNVVEAGHGRRAGVPGYFVAGKTGTAQVARSDRPGYDPDRTIGTFAGFGPVDSPAFVIVVKISNPKTVEFAENTAAPAFGEIARFLFNHFQIPPSR